MELISFSNRLRYCFYSLFDPMRFQNDIRQLW